MKNGALFLLIDFYSGLWLVSTAA